MKRSGFKPKVYEPPPAAPLRALVEEIKFWFACFYWLPTFLRCVWKHDTGRLFVFRDESQEFLQWLTYETGGPDGEVESDPEMCDFYRSAREEIAMRQRRGEWMQ